MTEYHVSNPNQEAAMADIPKGINGIPVPLGEIDRVILNKDASISRTHACGWFEEVLKDHSHLDIMKPSDIVGGGRNGIHIHVY